MKDNYTPETLCAGLPGKLIQTLIYLDTFVLYMNYVKGLEFE
jgi:hypothetical protein